MKKYYCDKIRLVQEEDLNQLLGLCGDLLNVLAECTETESIEPIKLRKLSLTGRYKSIKERI